MKVLFIGGTGIISSACTPRCVEMGMDLYLLNRGKSDRNIPAGVKVLKADINDIEQTKSALADNKFDCVVDWIAFTPDHVQRDLELFRERTEQYIFISSASVYQTPPLSLPITEETPAENPIWEYSQNKIKCEELLLNEYREKGFPAVIVRPSHTYDCRVLPFEGRYNYLYRLKQGKKVLIHGDGTSLWVMTHHRDFAKGFCGIIGKKKTIGEIYHITSDELLSWNRIGQLLADAAGLEFDPVYVPSRIIAKYHKHWGDSLLGDKAHSMVFDNSKIKKLVPEFSADISYAEGASEIVKWFEEDESRQVIDQELDEITDRIISDAEKAGLC